ncbi:MAG: SCP2 sterol-binding domain-containing protein [Pseudomonadota bacterium]
MIKSIALTALETTINKYLALDNTITTKLQPLVNKIVQIEFTDIHQLVYLLFTDKYILLQSHVNRQADLSISGNLLSFITMATQKNSSNLPENMRLVGNAHLAQQFQLFMNAIDIDWEEQLAKFTGDTAATRITRVCQKIKQSAQHNSQRLQHNTTEFLQQELAAMPTQEMVERYCHGIDDLRHHLARLEARTKRLEMTLKADHG